MKPSTPFSIQDLKTQEEYLEILNEQGDLMIGVPKEAGQEEKRVCLTPDAVAALVANNHQVIIASGAGEEASFSDEEYRKAGARITTFKKEVFECPLVLKIAPPNAEEIALLKPNSTIISVVQKKTQTKDYFKALEQKKNYRYWL